ncbi:LysR family transcriptional regulator [Pseudomonas gingeri]|uniref:LysR family transcriptional regulator n=1 Tax=Pseudomonas gingeri TaxID=117681 RepID=A0A7Y7X9J9_9PSED|nr:LysR substrate-binding domain-containing protein [Pseudomonas gingeri]NWB95819.1 LysR family transcriptional regulator [Pseudomonas gingeri]
MAQRPPPTTMLQAFVHAGKTGSFARAAAELNFTASAVSHQISGLEEWWGVQLFERHSRGVKLTAAGQALLPIAQNFFTDLETTLNRLNPGKPAPLQLYCTSSLGAAWLSPRLYASHDDRRLNLDVVLTNAELSDANLNSSPYDVAIVIGQGHFPGNHVQRLMGDAVFPVCSPRFLQTHGPIQRDEISSYPLIYRVDDAFCPGWEDWFAWQGLTQPPYHPGPRFPDSNMTIGLAAKGVGIALARTSLVQDKLRDATLVLLGGPAMPSPSAYYVVCRSGREQEPDIARLIDWLQSQAAAFQLELCAEFPELPAATVG